MRPGNFAHDIQSEPEAAVGILAVRMRRASLEWIKDLVQSRSIDGRSAAVAGVETTDEEVRELVARAAQRT